MGFFISREWIGSLSRFDSQILCYIDCNIAYLILVLIDKLNLVFQYENHAFSFLKSYSHAFYY